MFLYIKKQNIFLIYSLKNIILYKDSKIKIIIVKILPIRLACFFKNHHNKFRYKLLRFMNNLIKLLF